MTVGLSAADRQNSIEKQDTLFPQSQVAMLKLNANISVASRKTFCTMRRFHTL
jgi:hypothetical protein